MANEQLKDLLSALDDFKSNVQEYNKFSAIQSANDAVNQIRASQESEVNKRNALQGLANDLVTRLAQSGTPATTIQQIAGAVAPQQFTSPEQAVISGVLSGKESEVEAGVEARRLIEEPREEARLKRDMIRMGIEEKKLEAKTQREAAKLDVGSRDEIVAGMNVVKILADLDDQVQKISRTAQIGTRLGLQRANAELAALKTKAEALVVDVARASEKGVLTDSDVKRYQELVGSIGDVRSLESLRGSWAALGERARLKLDSRFTALEDEGKNVANHRQTLARLEEKLSSRAAAGAPQVRREKRKQKSTGKVVTVEVAPDGRVIRVVE